MPKEMLHSAVQSCVFDCYMIFTATPVLGEEGILGD